MKDLLSALIRSENIRWKILILIFPIVITAGSYIYIAKVFTPKDKLISSIMSPFSEKKDLTFFSGPVEGFYSKIGTAISEEINNSESSMNLEVVRTSGGYENAIKVLSTPHSFGLTQEDTIKKNDFIYEDIQFITPLYLSRMHVLYRDDKIKADWKEPNIKISSKLNKDSIKFFSNARISTGPVGSSTRIFSSYILNHIHNKNDLISDVNNDSKTLSLSFEDSFTKLYEGKIDMVFFFAGAPLEKVKEALSKENIRLMSIEPSVVAGLNKEFDLNFKISDFKDKYTADFSDHKSISTLGSYAFLIASKDISHSDTMKLITALEDRKEAMKSISSDDDTFQLNEFNFYNSVELANTNKYLSLVQKILIFVVPVFIMTVAIVRFLVWLVSWFKHNKYFKRMYDAVDSNELDRDINSLDKSLFEFLEISKNLSKDYQTGGISEGHYTFISNNLDNKINKLGGELYRKLKISIEDGEKISLDDIKSYFSFGFINNDQYCDLKNIELNR